MFRRHSFDHDHHSRLFEKGDLKYVILDLIKDKPCHGYEIIREMEDRFHGFYSPSPGSVYPMLQLLDDLGYIRSAERDGKKTYTITDEGKQFLDEQGETIDRIKAHLKDSFGKGSREEFRDAAHELRNLGHLIARKVRRMDSPKLARIKAIIAQAGKDIEAIIDE
jgi:DNA-binding PadR family transcriptional regulator